ncbi:MAG: aldo/keto reductase [Acidimicrobiaceae bacterium]|nr:aldo/keto reductase [Acidimicrobiaceae bacterium]
MALEYATLGRTGMEVSRIGFGCAGLGNEYGGLGDDEAVAAVHHALDQGINYFDTSTYYGRGLSEQRLGLALEGQRDQIVLATKGGRFDAPLETGFDFSYDSIIAMCEASLRRLRTDRVDVYQLHDIEFGDKEVVFGEALPALIDLKAAGKALHIGVTGYPLPLLVEAVENFPLDVVLSYCRYNLMDRSLQTDLIPVAQKRGTAVINGSILHMGLISERGPQDWHPATDRIKDVSARLREHCRDAGIALSTLGVQFALANDDIEVTLLGSSRISTLDSALAAAAQGPPPEDLLSEVEAVIGPENFNLAWASGRPEHWEPSVAGSTAV